jgi:hypothetical protein
MQLECSSVNLTSRTGLAHVCGRGKGADHRTDVTGSEGDEQPRDVLWEISLPFLEDR